MYDPNDPLREPLLPNEKGGAAAMMTTKDEEEVAPLTTQDNDDGSKAGPTTTTSHQDDEESGVSVSQSSSYQWWCNHAALHKPLLPDNDTAYTVCGVRLVDEGGSGTAAIRLLKFLLLTWITLVMTYLVVRLLDLEHDGKLRLSDVYMYESPLLVMDCLVFFCVGRLYKQAGVDHVAWMGMVVLAQVYYSVIIPTLSFLKHSVTLYEIHCTWPWQLWLFVLILTPLIITIILLHVRHAVRTGVFVSKLIEMALCVLMFLVPYLPSSFLHLHHWYAGWLIGMHANFNVWWSRLTMAWMWGIYINGIAVWGRDPVLTCGYSLWLSQDLRCPYLDCYNEGIQQPSSNETNHVEPMEPPDWRNCSANDYHP